MCGVAGIFHYAELGRSPDRDALVRMTRALRHRGPDDEGIHIDGPLGLGHRRLSIVDLSPTGKQPMVADDDAAISYNGEAYNHARFRPRLEARGVRFRGTSDTETILHLLRLEGPGALADVAGIFAFAFWDARRRRLILARDPLGVKQLYYHDDGKRIVFASEIKALLCHPGVLREIDPDGVNDYLHFHTPLFERTFFRGVRQLRAGEFLEVSAQGVFARAYWQVDGFEPDETHAESRVRQLEELLAEVVSEQLMSDVPVGAFFSGGIDSTAVAAFAQETGRSIRCFGVHFTGQGVIDERPYQEAAAKALGVTLDLTTFDGAGFEDDFSKLLYAQDQPVVGAAMLPMYYVSKLASEHVKVCLGGQAADEIFGGYARHALVQPARVLASWFDGRKPASHAPKGEAIPPNGDARVGGNLAKQLFDWKNARRLVQRAPHWMDWRARYFEHFAKVPAADWAGVLGESRLFSRAAAFEAFCDGVASSSAREPVDKVFHWEMRTYLTALFQQDDRMSMAHSLESRVPLADPRMVRFAFHTPATMKLRAGATKWILRQAVASRIPEVVLNRRKVGFDTPAEAWMRGPHKDFVRDLLLSTRARQRGWTVAREVEGWLDHPERPYWFDVIWKLSCIEGWARLFVDGEGRTEQAVEGAHVATA
jgi:asparagine synthase (glutamine-hydrolysing)